MSYCQATCHVSESRSFDDEKTYVFPDESSFEPLLLNASRVPTCFIAILVSRPTAARGPKPLDIFLRCQHALRLHAPPLKSLARIEQVGSTFLFPPRAASTSTLWTI